MIKAQLTLTWGHYVISHGFKSIGIFTNSANDTQVESKHLSEYSKIFCS